MSWYSDGEPFDEFDPPFCEDCERKVSAEECRRCYRWHMDEIKEYEEQKRRAEEEDDDIL